MKTQTYPQTRKNQGREKSFAFWKKTALCAALVGLAAGTASAITLVSEDFNSYSGAQTSFSSTTVAIPNTDRIRVEDGLAQGDSPNGLGWNGVQLVSTWIPASAHNSGNAMLLRPNTAFWCNLDPRGGDTYTWEFSMLSSKSGSADRGFRILLSEQGADQNAQDFLVFRSGQASTTNNLGQPGGINVDGVDIIQAFNGFNAASGFLPANQWVTISNTAAGTPAFVTNNVWNHYKIVADAVARTFTFYVNNMVTPVNTVNYLSRPQNLPVAGIRFAHEGNSADDGYTLIDNVSLTVTGNFIDLATGSYTDGFEAYTASDSSTVTTADNDPGGPWVTAETTGVGNNNTFAPVRVQVVDSSVTAPHGGSKCLMVQQKQTSGVSISWGQATNEDVRITWWAKVPGQTNSGVDAVYLRVSGYAWEADYSAASDTVLFGWGRRQTSTGFGTTNSIITFNRWFSEWFFGGQWGDTLQTYTPDTWEEYQLTTDVRRNSYDLVKNPSSTPVTVVRDGQYISSWGNNKKFHTIGFATSNVPGGGTDNPPAYIDDITIAPYTNTNAPAARPYTIQGTGPAARFTNYTVLTVPGKTVGGVAMNPLDTNTILFTIDEERIGAIMKATKVASGNWAINPVPVVSGLYNPNSLTINTNGDLWFVRDGVKGGQSSGLMRLKFPWNLNTVEEVVTDFGSSITNRSDQPCDLAFFVQGGVTKLAVLDRGTDLNNDTNAIWVVDPATATLNQANYNTSLVAPDRLSFGAGLVGNANGIALLPSTGELVTIWEGNGDGITLNNVVVAWDPTTGVPRNIFDTPATILWGAGIDVDPTTGRIWVSDRRKTIEPLSAFAVPQIVSLDPTTGASAQELSFTNTAPTLDRPDRNIHMKDPGMRFSKDGSFLVVSDQSLHSGGGRLLVFHSEPFAFAPFSITAITSASGCVTLTWGSAGAANYVVQSTSSLSPVVTWTDISPVLTGTSYTDCSAAPKYYRVVASPQ